jgi:oxygen-independent coproporphyrinogen-3 oxidase
LHGKLAQADEELEREMYLAAIDELSAAGFEHYEVSSFARAGHRCRHNETYWTGAPYFAAGPGAARFVGGRRETNHKSTTTWLRRVLAGESPVAESERLSGEAAARERLVFGLRRIEGLDLATFAAATSYDAVALGGEPLARFVAHGLLTLDAGRLKLTREGLLVSDALWPDLLD